MHNTSKNIKASKKLEISNLLATSIKQTDLSLLTMAIALGADIKEKLIIWYDDNSFEEFPNATLAALNHSFESGFETLLGKLGVDSLGPSPQDFVSSYKGFHMLKPHIKPNMRTTGIMMHIAFIEAGGRYKKTIV